MTETTDLEVLSNKLRTRADTLARRIGYIRQKTGLPDSALPKLGQLLMSGAPHPDYRGLAELFTCRVCGLPQSPERFPFYPHDTRCASCAGAQNQTYCKIRIRDAVMKTLDKVLSKAKLGRPTVPEVERVINGVFDRLGGPEAFAEMWAANLMEMKEKNFGTKVFSDQCGALAKFYQEVLRIKGEEVPIEKKSDDELKQLRQQLCAEFFEDMYATIGKNLQEGLVKLIDPDVTPDQIAQTLMESFGEQAAEPKAGDVLEPPPDGN